MKKLIPFILITSLIISACSVGGIDKDKQFEKQKDCLSMKESMLQFAKSLKPQIWQIDEIFFSYSKNTCYFITRETRDIDEGFSRDFATLFDYLNQKMLIETPLATGDGRYLDDGSFQKEIQKLKGE